eukprot:g1940.t1
MWVSGISGLQLALERVRLVPWDRKAREARAGYKMPAPETKLGDLGWESGDDLVLECKNPDTGEWESEEKQRGENFMRKNKLLRQEHTSSAQSSGGADPELAAVQLVLNSKLRAAKWLQGDPVVKAEIDLWWQKIMDAGMPELSDNTRNMLIYAYMCGDQKEVDAINVWTGNLRFKLGQTISCQAGGRWIAGVITVVRHREPEFPPWKVVPYKVKCADGVDRFAPSDTDTVIRGLEGEEWLELAAKQGDRSALMKLKRRQRKKLLQPHLQGRSTALLTAEAEAEWAKAANIRRAEQLISDERRMVARRRKKNKQQHKQEQQQGQQIVKAEENWSTSSPVSEKKDRSESMRAVLAHLHPGLTIGAKAMCKVDELLKETVAALLAAMNKSTGTDLPVEEAVKTMLPGGLKRQALSELEKQTESSVFNFELTMPSSLDLRVSKATIKSLSIIEEYIASEILELAGNETCRKGVEEVTSQDVCSAIKKDAELSGLGDGVLLELVKTEACHEAGALKVSDPSARAPATGRIDTDDEDTWGESEREETAAAAKVKDKEKGGKDRESKANKKESEANDKETKEAQANNKETEANDKETETNDKEVEANDKETEANDKETEANDKETETNDKEVEANDKETETNDNETEANDKETETNDNETEANDNEADTNDNETETNDKEVEVNDKEVEANDKETEANDNETEANDKETEASDKETETNDKEVEANDKETEAKDKEAEAKDKELAERYAQDDQVATEEVDQLWQTLRAPELPCDEKKEVALRYLRGDQFVRCHLKRFTAVPRFIIGQTVECNLDVGWVPGRVTSLQWHDPRTPEWQLHPYRVTTIDKLNIYVPSDSDDCIKKLSASEFKKKALAFWEAKQLRFGVGQTVLCRCHDTWIPGQVVDLKVRDDEDKFEEFVPYKIKDFTADGFITAPS